MELCYGTPESMFGFMLIKSLDLNVCSCFFACFCCNYNTFTLFFLFIVATCTCLPSLHLWNKYIIVTLGSSYHWRRQEKLDHSSTKMNHAEKVFNPLHHPSDIQTAFTRFVRKFGYTYNGENRTVPTAIVNTPATAAITNASADWKKKDKAKLFYHKQFLKSFWMTTRWLCPKLKELT